MKQLIQLAVLLIAIQILYGCASIYTVTQEPEAFEEITCSSNCPFLPRVYSGAIMDLCGMFSGDGGQGAAIMFYDFFLSVPMDTVLLPYTVYGQIKHGNLSAPEKCLE